MTGGSQRPCAATQYRRSGSKNCQSRFAPIGYRPARPDFSSTLRAADMQNSNPAKAENLSRTALLIFLFAASACCSVAANAQTLALVGGTVYTSPDAAPLVDAVVLASNGVITAIGSRSEVKIPAAARAIDCTGKAVVAGFWNSTSISRKRSGKTRPMRRLHPWKSRCGRC